MGLEGKSDAGDAVDVTQTASAVADDADFNEFTVEFMYNDAGILHQSFFD
jgi:hypothetical protein